MNNAALKKLIDEYGSLDERIKKLQAEFKVTKQKLEDLELKPGTYFGRDYELTISEVERVEYDPVKVASVLPKKQLVKVIKIKSDIKKYLLPAQLTKLVKSVSTFMQYRPKKRR